MSQNTSEAEAIAETAGASTAHRAAPSTPHALLSSAMARARAAERWQKRLILVVLDMVLCTVAAFVAFSLRVGAFSFPAQPVFLYLALAIPLFLAIFWRVGVYRSVLRFFGGRNLRQIALAVAAYTLPLMVVFMLIGVPGIPRTVSVIHPMTFFGFVVISRLLARFLLVDIERTAGAGEDRTRVLIYGAGFAGQQLASQLEYDGQYDPVAFIDDLSQLEGAQLNGRPVHNPDKLEALIRENGIELILLAMPSIERSRRRIILDRLGNFNVEVKTLPGLGELVDGKVSISDLRSVSIEDLLGRDPVPPNELLLARSIADKVVMVTGAGGSIGSELCRQIAAMGPTALVLVEFSEPALYAIEREVSAIAGEFRRKTEIVPQLVSVTDARAIQAIFARWKPQTVFHAAAYKHVPLVEANALEGLANNVSGTDIVARAARDFATERFILVSTDKAVRPTNVMGASKRICELVLENLSRNPGKTSFAMVRFGNVLGSSGSVVPLFRQQIAAGGPVTVTDRRMTRYFMTIPEAAQLVIQAGGMARGGEVYLLDMGDPMRILDLATTMIHLSGLSVRDEKNPAGDIEIEQIGLRPGEKLFEELLVGAEAQATVHPKIFRARDNENVTGELAADLEAMKLALAERDEDRTIAQMRVLVPEYAGDRGLPSSQAAIPLSDEFNRAVAS